MADDHPSDSASTESSTESRSRSERPPRRWLPSLQLLTNLAVVGGIAALVFELNQTRDLAQVQTFDNGYLAAMSRNLALLGESPEESMARAVFEPEAVTRADAVVLNQYFTAIVVNWTRIKDPRAVGYFDPNWQAAVRAEAFHLNNTIGRRWWAAYRSFGDPDLVAVVDEMLAASRVETSREFLQNLLTEDDRGSASTR